MEKSNQTQQVTSRLTPSASALITLFVGLAALGIGIYATPSVTIIGNNISQHSSDKFASFAGAILATFGPILPYVLLGGVVTIISYFSGYFGYIMLVILSLSLGVFIFHMYSSMLPQLGEKFSAKGLISSHALFATLYFIAGLITIFIMPIREHRSK